MKGRIMTPFAVDTSHRKAILCLLTLVLGMALATLAVAPRAFAAQALSDGAFSSLAAGTRAVAHLRIVAVTYCT